MSRIIRHLDKILGKWFVPTSSGLHFDVADGVRGLAIVMVVVAHGLYSNPNGPALFILVSGLARAGTLGVPIFFVLSGFLLALPFLRGREQNRAFWYCPGFATRRVLKIVPPFYLVILVLVLFHYFQSGDAGYFRLGLAWATGVAHFIRFTTPLNGSFWSLWVEIGFYAILPFLFLAVRGSSARLAGWILFAALIGIAVVGRLTLWGGAADSSDWFFVTSRFPNSLDTFGWGILFASFYLAKAGEPERWRKLARFGYLGLLLLACAGLFIFFAEYYATPGKLTGRWEVEVRHFLPGIGAFFLLFFVFDSNCLAARFFSSPGMRFLGVVSYEWFLIHQPIQVTVRNLSSGSHGSAVRYVLIIATSTFISLGLAALMYHQFSLPIMKWGRGKLK